LITIALVAVDHGPVAVADAVDAGNGHPAAFGVEETESLPGWSDARHSSIDAERVRVDTSPAAEDVRAALG
jgi:hypothetical protein